MSDKATKALTVVSEKPSGVPQQEIAEKLAVAKECQFSREDLIQDFERKKEADPSATFTLMGSFCPLCTVALGYHEKNDVRAARAQVEKKGTSADSALAVEIGKSNRRQVNPVGAACETHAEFVASHAKKSKEQIALANHRLAVALMKSGTFSPARLMLVNKQNFDEKTTSYIESREIASNTVHAGVEANNHAVCATWPTHMQQAHGDAILKLEVPLMAYSKYETLSNHEVDYINDAIREQFGPGATGGGHPGSGVVMFSAAVGGHNYWLHVHDQNGQQIGYADAGPIGEALQGIYADNAAKATPATRRSRNKSPAPVRTPTPKGRSARQATPRATSATERSQPKSRFYRASGGGDGEETAQIPTEIWNKLPPSAKAAIKASRQGDKQDF